VSQETGFRIEKSRCGKYFNTDFFSHAATKGIFIPMHRVKKILWVVWLLQPLLLLSQECSIHKETDPFTKETRLTTGFIPLKNATLSIQADKSEIDFFFVLEGKDKCFSDASTASIFFEGTRVKTNLRNGGSMNCDGYFHFIFKNQPVTAAALKKMAAQKVTHILFTGNNKSETQLTLNPEQQEKLMHFVNCMIEEAQMMLPKKE
jgi:hypothetical protein